MSDKPRPWPNTAKEFRDRSAEQALKGIDALRPLVSEERKFTETEILRRTGTALQALYEILRAMETAGAPTRPTMRN
jgi:hypothetical protein